MSSLLILDLPRKMRRPALSARNLNNRSSMAGQTAELTISLIYGTKSYKHPGAVYVQKPAKQATGYMVAFHP